MEERGVVGVSGGTGLGMEDSEVTKGPFFYSHRLALD